MKYYNLYFKILLIILLVSIIYCLCNKFKEEFESFNKPLNITPSISKDDNNDTIKITWRRRNENIKRYYIILYKNNRGPYIINPNFTDMKLDIFDFEYIDTMKNVEYKFGVIAENDKKLTSDIDKFISVKLTLNDIETKFVDSSTTKVFCNPDGSYSISDTCQNKITEFAKIYDSNKESIFNHNIHDKLMNDLNKKYTLNFSAQP